MIINPPNAGTIVLPLSKNIYVLAFGKAVLGMLHVVSELFGDEIACGHASIPAGTVPYSKCPSSHTA
jgi:hypothetical protein